MHYSLLGIMQDQYQYHSLKGMICISIYTLYPPSSKEQGEGRTVLFPPSWKE